MKASRWIATLFGLTLVSIAISILIPGGINIVYTLLGMEGISVGPMVRFFTFLVSFLVLLHIQHVLWTRSEIEELHSDVEETSRSTIRQSTEETMQSRVFSALLSEEPGGDLAIRETVSELEQTLAVMDGIPEPLLRGYFVILKREIDSVRDCLRKLSEGGVLADIRDHISISRQISMEGGNYTQIQRKAFNVPEEWTEEWIEFVSTLPKRCSECKYILLLPEKCLQEQVEKARRMGEFLEEREVQFKVCTLETVEDSIGEIPTNKVVEIFDGEYVKLSGLPEGQYRGGAEVELELKRLEEDRSLERFVSCVLDAAESPEAYQMRD